MDSGENKKKYRIGNVALVLLGASAIIADLATLIPIVGSFLGWIYWGGISLILWKMGLGLVNWRKLVPILVSTVAEFFPVAQELPTIVAAMAIIIAISRAEDKTGLKMLPTKNKKGITLPRKYTVPLNKDGKRLPRQNNSIIEETA